MAREEHGLIISLPDADFSPLTLLALSIIVVVLIPPLVYQGVLLPY